jgi:dihydroorotase
MRREPALIALALSALAEAGCGRLHIQHVSLAESAQLIAAAKAQGLPVTAEVSPHHLLLCAEDIPLHNGEPDANWKMNPPLRSREDMRAMRRALADGTIDVIATDHAPHTPAEKAQRWDEAPFGVIGLETAFAACMSLVHDGTLAFTQLINALNPTLPTAAASWTYAQGYTLVDPNAAWTVDPERFYSKGRNCPFAGMTLTGKPVYTIVNGKIVMAEGEVLF